MEDTAVKGWELYSPRRGVHWIGAWDDTCSKFVPLSMLDSHPAVSFLGDVTCTTATLPGHRPTCIRFRASASDKAAQLVIIMEAHKLAAIQNRLSGDMGRSFRADALIRWIEGLESPTEAYRSLDVASRSISGAAVGVSYVEVLVANDNDGHEIASVPMNCLHPLVGIWHASNRGVDNDALTELRLSGDDARALLASYNKPGPLQRFRRRTLPRIEGRYLDYLLQLLNRHEDVHVQRRHIQA
tara:strand:+ start:616 stop:1341 length:726 start_codon:yes stop_codon:yes gene_type:complete